tara:strand:+ start:159 stop:320 length:162 start_codon:yes stop_codon:yes gene_type:complete
MEVIFRILYAAFIASISVAFGVLIGLEGLHLTMYVVFSNFITTFLDLSKQMSK